MSNLALVRDEQDTGMYKWIGLLAKAKKAMDEGTEIRIKPSQVRKMPGQPRTYFNPNTLQLLADSMEAVGQIYPGIVRLVSASPPVEYELLDGERRWRAATMRSLPFRALLVDVDDDSVPFIVAAVANFNRESHTPIEVSDSIERMSQLTIPLKEIANILGLSQNWVMKIHGLQRLHPKVREMLDPALPKDKMLPVMAAIEISHYEQRFQVALANRVLSKKVTIKTLRSAALKATKKGGGIIRTRRSEPVKVWTSIQSLSRLAQRTLTDLEFTLGEDGSFTAIDQRSKSEINKVLEILEDVKSSASRCRQKITKIREM